MKDIFRLDFFNMYMNNNFEEGYKMTKKQADLPLVSDIQDPNGYINSFKNIMNYNKQYRPKNVNDKYKHAMINCLMVQNGSKSEKVSQILSGLKENYDVLFNKNTSQASDEDMEANIYGRNIGRTYPQRSCHDLITQKYNP